MTRALVVLACLALVGCGDGAGAGVTSVLPGQAADAGDDVGRPSPGPGATDAGPAGGDAAADVGGPPATDAGPAGGDAAAEVGGPSTTDAGADVAGAQATDAGPAGGDVAPAPADVAPEAPAGPLPECPVNTGRTKVCGLGATQGTCADIFHFPHAPVSGCFIRDDVDYHFVCVDACP